MIPATCDNCDKSLRHRDEVAGKRIKCPHCGAAIAVPPPNEDIPPAPIPKIAIKPKRPARDRGVGARSTPRVQLLTRP
jgi:hypothetical protein